MGSGGSMGFYSPAMSGKIDEIKRESYVRHRHTRRARDMWPGKATRRKASTTHVVCVRANSGNCRLSEETLATGLVEREKNTRLPSASSFTPDEDMVVKKCPKREGSLDVAGEISIEFGMEIKNH